MRVWLQKQKKKEEAKAAAQAATPAPETTPAATEVPSEAEGPDKPIDSVEEVPVTADAPAEPAAVAAAADAGEGHLRTGSVSAQPNEVGSLISPSATRVSVCTFHKNKQWTAGKSERLNIMNTIDLACAGGCSILNSSRAFANIEQGSTAPDNDDSKRRGSLVSQTAKQSGEPSAAHPSPNEQGKTDGPANMTSINPMMNGMQGQMGFGFQNGMGFNGMSNMMGNAGWNNMNAMGMSLICSYLDNRDLTANQITT